MKEWKTIEGWSDYKISSDGEVFSIRKNRLLKGYVPTKYIKGRLYPSVVLAKDKVNKQFSIHRLVAIHFIPNPENKPCVNHINGNKLDFSIENLEWCTYSENELHSFNHLGKQVVHSEKTKEKMRIKATGRDMSIPVASSASKRRGKPSHNRVSVSKYTKDGVFIDKYENLGDAAKSVDGTIPAFSMLKNGILKTYKNYKWVF